MKSPLHILHLEDDSNDAVLVQRALEAEMCIRDSPDIQRGGGADAGLHGGGGDEQDHAGGHL